MVSVFLSGRPLWVNPEINASDAFVAAFLPGGEGGGIADVLLPQGGRRGELRFPRQASLQLAEARRPEPLNVGDKGYDPLFAFGYGLRYGQKATSRAFGGAARGRRPARRRAVRPRHRAAGWSFGLSPQVRGPIEGRRPPRPGRFAAAHLDRERSGNGARPRQSAARPFARNNRPAQPGHRLSRRSAPTAPVTLEHGAGVGADRRGAARAPPGNGGR